MANLDMTTIVTLIACFGAAILLFGMAKENKLFLWAGVFFGCVGAFYLIKAFTGDLLSAPWISLGFRAVALVVLCVFCYFYYKERQNDNGGSK